MGIVGSFKYGFNVFTVYRTIMTKAATSARGTMKTLHSWASLAVNRCRHPCDDALPAKQSLELI